MKDYRLILSLTLRNRLAFLRKGSLRRADGGIDIGRIASAVLMAVLFVGLAVMLIVGETALYRVLAVVGQPALLPALAVLACMASTLMLSFFHMLSSLYFSRDTLWLSYLPVRPHAIFAAKFTEVWAAEALFSIAVLTPAFVLYGMNQGADVGFYLRMIPVILLTPVIPLVVIAVLTTLLACLTALVRNKEAVTMGGSMVMALGIVALEMAILPHLPEDADMAFFIQMFMEKEGLVNALASSFPPVKWAVSGVAGDWALFCLFVGLCLLLAAALCAVMGRHYLSIAMRQGERGTRRRALRTTGDTFRGRSALRALLHREFTEILRTPAYLMNCLGGLIMLPLMAVVMCVAATAEGEIDLAMLLAELNGLLCHLHPADLALVVGTVMSLGSFMNPAGATAVSREGGRLAFSRMLPVPALTQLRAKQGCALICGGVSIPVALALCAVLAYSQPAALAMGVVLALTFNYAVTTGSLVVDTLRPNFHWTSEVQVIKQSANVAFSMLIGAAALVLPALPVILLSGTTSWVRLAMAAGILAAEAVAAEMLLHSVGVKRYAALEASD